ncbi:cytochrome-c peroxidase [Rubritalea sp.]|uniref:cytochrome-c peroxidase n=1 Tax=Rubritalea sp. TaxID=2109375 RepID=UPI003EFAF3D1
MRSYYAALTLPAEAGEKASLGHKLFFDSRLSADGQSSCVSCHSFDAYGTNRSLLRTQKKEGNFYRDIPSVLNAAQLESYSWEGSIKSLTAKISGSLDSQYEMGEGAWDARLKRLAPYEKMFHTVYPEDGMTKETIVDALCAYQEQLVARAPIDAFIEGDDEALTLEQIEGYATFDRYNCSTCHTGAHFGGQMIQRMGIVRPWPNQEDLGYYHTSGDSAHKMLFRVAPLRNVTATRPYFHDASSRTILDAIRKMGEYEAGVMISDEDTLKIFEFLKALKGDLPEEWVKEPELLE